MTRSGDIRELHPGQWNASYRRLTVALGPEADLAPLVILSGTFRVTPGVPEHLAAESMRLRRLRETAQPLGQPSAGCVFRNPSPENPAGMLIDRAGLKGLTVGGARVSEKHANFIVTTRNARADDILQLMEEIRRRVQERFGILLENELIVL
jgi:UDP-N-acetylmuramate dehydrogenase